MGTCDQSCSVKLTRDPIAGETHEAAHPVQHLVEPSRAESVVCLLLIMKAPAMGRIPLVYGAVEHLRAPKFSGLIGY